MNLLLIIFISIEKREGTRQQRNPNKIFFEKQKWWQSKTKFELMKNTCKMLNIMHIEVGIIILWKRYV